MEQAQLDRVLAEAASRWKVPGANLTVWADGKLTTSVWGVLNADTAEPVKPFSLFQIGSITKVITATLVLILRDRELVDLDQPVRDYLPDFRIADLAASRSITVRQLLNHTSGIAGDFFPDTGMGPDRLERYLDRCANLPLAHPPGGGFSYSNAAYCIAGLLVERTSGLSFERCAQEWLFDALGLKNSVMDPLRIVGRSAAAGHGPDPENPEAQRPLGSNHMISPSTGPAGATTVMNGEDLVTFARMHLDQGRTDAGEQILSSAACAEMREMGVTIPIPQREISHWGLGWFYLSQGESTLFGHDGGTVGQSSFLRVHEPTRTIVSLLTNGGSANDCMYEVFEQTVQPLTGFAHAPPLEPTGEAPDDLGKYVGRFETVAAVTEFWIEDGCLKRRATMTLDEVEMPEPESVLHYVGDSMFLNYPPGGGRPVLVCFMEPDARGVPQVLFYGLRVARRVSSW